MAPGLDDADDGRFDRHALTMMRPVSRSGRRSCNHHHVSSSVRRPDSIVQSRPFRTGASGGTRRFRMEPRVPASASRGRCGPAASSPCAGHEPIGEIAAHLASKGRTRRPLASASATTISSRASPWPARTASSAGIGSEKLTSSSPRSSPTASNQSLSAPSFPRRGSPARGRDRRACSGRGSHSGAATGRRAAATAAPARGPASCRGRGGSRSRCRCD